MGRHAQRHRFGPQANCDAAVVVALLRAHPAAATCRDDENQVPLDYAISYGLSSAAALAALVAADMPIDASGAPAPRHQSSFAKVVKLPRMTVRIELCQPLTLSPIQCQPCCNLNPTPDPNTDY